MKLKRLLIGTLAVVIASAALAMPVAAHEGHDEATTNNATTMPIFERAKGKLDDARKKVCENRLGTITAIVSKAATTSTRQLNLFTDIAAKVQKFYTDKKLSASNYDTAVANVAAKKAAAQTAIDAVKSSNTSQVNCGGDDPGGQVVDRRVKIFDMHSALKAYRTAIKDLITVVKTALSAAGES